MKYKGLFFLLGGLLFGILLGGLVLLGGPNPSTPASNRQLPPTVGSVAYDFQLETLDQNKVSLKEYTGKPVILNFWATWCLPCKDEMPLLDRYAQQYSDQVIILGVNSGEAVGTVQQFIDEQDITFTILLDSKSIVSDQYFVHNFPLTFFIDKEGILRAEHIGVLSETLMNEYLNLIGIDI